MRPPSLVQKSLGKVFWWSQHIPYFEFHFSVAARYLSSFVLLKRRETSELSIESWLIHWIAQNNRGQENKKLWIYTSSLTLNRRLAVHSLSSRHGVIRVHCVGMIFLGSPVPWKDEPGQNRDVLLAATGTAATSTGQRPGQNERAYSKNTWLATNPSTCYIVNFIFIEQQSVYIEIQNKVIHI